MLWYSVLIQCAFVGTKIELSINYMKTKILAGILAALAIAPGVALARGGGGGGSHGGGGFTHHGFVSDRSFRFVRGFRHDHDRFFGHHFVFGNPWPGYYDPYYLGAHDDYTAHGYRDVMPLESVNLADERHHPVPGDAERIDQW